jgi:hypothetical protein
VNISSGDLVTCLYEAENYPAQKFLSIIKIDPSEIFLHETKLDEHGQPYVDLQLQPDALPTTKEKLQKCAFIRPMNPRPDDYDMLLLDRQTGAIQGLQVARFFIHDFLDAELAHDTQTRTRKLYSALVSAHNQIRPSLTEQENMDLDDRIRTAVTNRSINLDTWLEQLPIADKNKQIINKMLLDSISSRRRRIAVWRRASRVSLSSGIATSRP